MATRKQLAEVRGKLTREARAAREKAEHLVYELGAPPCPQGLPRTVRRWWSRCEAALLKKGWLARTDGEAFLAMVQAQAAGNHDEVVRRLEIFKQRGPVPPPAVPVEEEKPTRVSLTPVDITAAAKEYASDCLSGKILAGLLVKKACARFLKDLDRTDITYDVTAAQHVGDYMARLGLELLGWEAFLLGNLFGFKKLSGVRRFSLCYIEVAKKNGKSTLMAALGLYMADPQGDGEPRGDVFVAATTKAQSKDIVFLEAKRFVKENTDLSERTECYMAEIAFPGAGKFAPLASNSDKLNGLNMHFGILDELADHPTPALFNVFKTSSVARKQPILCSITTAGHTRENIAYYQRTHAEQVLDGLIPDDEFFAYIATLDAEDVWSDETKWIKANPSLGVTVQLERLRTSCNQARNIRSLKADFLRFNINRWPTTSFSPWIDASDLEKPGCAFMFQSERAILNISERLASVEKRLLGQRCWAGLDLALVSDLSVLCLLFPPWDYKEDDGFDPKKYEPRVHDDGFECLFRIYCPEENIEERTKNHRVPYNEWRDQGLLTVTPGDTTDFEFVQKDVADIQNKFNLKEVGFDIALARDLAGKLEQNYAITMTQVRQGFGLHAAIQRVEKLVKEGKLCTHGNPIANWCFSNVVLSRGVRDTRFDKTKAREKIDAAVATANAVDVWLAAEQSAFRHSGNLVSF